jgi:hypothetical protein
MMGRSIGRYVGGIKKDIKHTFNDNPPMVCRKLKLPLSLCSLV